MPGKRIDVSVSRGPSLGARIGAGFSAIGNTMKAFSELEKEAKRDEARQKTLAEFNSYFGGGSPGETTQSSISEISSPNALRTPVGGQSKPYKEDPFNQPSLNMGNGSFATEMTQTVPTDMGWTNVPTIDPARGMSLTAQEGLRTELGRGRPEFFNTLGDAVSGAEARSASGGAYRPGSPSPAGPFPGSGGGFGNQSDMRNYLSLDIDKSTEAGGKLFEQGFEEARKLIGEDRAKGLRDLMQNASFRAAATDDLEWLSNLFNGTLKPEIKRIEDENGEKLKFWRHWLDKVQERLTENLKQSESMRRTLTTEAGKANKPTPGSITGAGAAKEVLGAVQHIAGIKGTPNSPSGRAANRLNTVELVTKQLNDPGIKTTEQVMYEAVTALVGSLGGTNRPAIQLIEHMVPKALLSKIKAGAQYVLGMPMDWATEDNKKQLLNQLANEREYFRDELKSSFRSLRKATEPYFLAHPLGYEKAAEMFDNAIYEKFDREKPGGVTPAGGMSDQEKSEWGL